MNTRLPHSLTDPGYLRTADDVRLFYRDWGRGQPFSS